MDLESYKASLSLAEPPGALSGALAALWHDARGDWHAAHARVQAEDGRDAAWVHAYLHRKEGDASNAAYWYRRAGHAVCETNLDTEWAAIAATLLASATG